MLRGVATAFQATDNAVGESITAAVNAQYIESKMRGAPRCVQTWAQVHSKKNESSSSRNRFAEETGTAKSSLRVP